MLFISPLLYPISSFFIIYTNVHPLRLWYQHFKLIRLIEIIAGDPMFEEIGSDCDISKLFIFILVDKLNMSF